MENLEKNHKQDLEIRDVKTNLKNIDEKVEKLDAKFEKFFSNDFHELKAKVDEILVAIYKKPDWKLITLLVSAIAVLLTVIGFLIK